MARLQNEVGTKDFYSRHEFSHEKCSEIVEPLFGESEKFHKISLPKSKKNSPTSFCRRAGRIISETLLDYCGVGPVWNEGQIAGISLAAINSSKKVEKNAGQALSESIQQKIGADSNHRSQSQSQKPCESAAKNLSS